MRSWVLVSLHAAIAVVAALFLYYVCITSLIVTGRGGIGEVVVYRPDQVPTGARRLPSDPGLPTGLDDTTALNALFTLGSLVVVGENTAATLMHPAPRRNYYITSELALERGMGALLVNMYGGIEFGSPSVRIPNLVPITQTTLAEIVSDIAIAMGSAEARAGAVVVLNVQQRSVQKTICTTDYIKSLHDALSPLRDLGILYAPSNLGSIPEYDDMALRLSEHGYPTADALKRRALFILTEDGDNSCASQYMAQYAVGDANLFFATGRPGTPPLSAFAQFTRVGSTFSEIENENCNGYPAAPDNSTCIPFILQIYDAHSIPVKATPGVYFPRSYTTCSTLVPLRPSVCIGPTA